MLKRRKIYPLIVNYKVFIKSFIGPTI